MQRWFFLLVLLWIGTTAVQAQQVRQLVGKQYSQLHELKGFEHYIPVKGYPVFDEMVCYRYQDTTTFAELMVFQKDIIVDGQTLHKVADVLKLDGTGRHKIVVVGANRFAAFSQRNIIIAVEDIDTSGQYRQPQKSIQIHSAYTLQHKGYVFEKVPTRKLYRIGDDFYKDR
jgi:hypothetical protein